MIYICIIIQSIRFTNVNSHYDSILGSVIIIVVRMKERIIQIMEREGLTPSKFAEEIGIQRSAMSHILSGRNNPSLDVLVKVLEKFTYVDSDWLLFGKGEMIRNQVYTEPDLFTNAPKFTPQVQVASEYRKENGLEIPKNMNKDSVIERVVCTEKPSKNVSKIMIFYSDNTFDTFIPEKIKKD